MWMVEPHYRRAEYPSARRDAECRPAAALVQLGGHRNSSLGLASPPHVWKYRCFSLWPWPGSLATLQVILSRSQMRDVDIRRSPYRRRARRSSPARRHMVPIYGLWDPPEARAREAALNAVVISRWASPPPPPPGPGHSCFGPFPLKTSAQPPSRPPAASASAFATAGVA